MNKSVTFLFTEEILKANNFFTTPEEAKYVNCGDSSNPNYVCWYDLSPQKIIDHKYLLKNGKDNPNTLQEFYFSLEESERKLHRWYKLTSEEDEDVLKIVEHLLQDFESEKFSDKKNKIYTSEDARVLIDYFDDESDFNAYFYEDKEDKVITFSTIFEDRIQNFVEENISFIQFDQDIPPINPDPWVSSDQKYLKTINIMPVWKKYPQIIKAGLERNVKIGDQKEELIAVIDSGVDFNIPELQGQSHQIRRPDQKYTNGYNATNHNFFDHSDEKGHGTFVTGLIGSLLNADAGVGIIPTIDILNIKAFPDGKRDSLANALYFAVKHRVTK